MLSTLSSHASQLQKNGSISVIASLGEKKIWSMNVMFNLHQYKKEVVVQHQIA